MVSLSYTGDSGATNIVNPDFREIPPMLVLSRRPGQRICIPELGISIEVLCSSGTVAKLGITAPLEVDVQRVEVLQRKNGSANDLAMDLGGASFE